MVRAVLFDLFETLVTESAAPPLGASRLGPELGLDEQAFRTEWHARRASIVTGRLSFCEALADIGSALGRHIESPDLERVRQRRLRTKAGPFARIEPEVIAALDALRDRGIRLAVVSNCFAEDVAAWATCSLAEYFDSTVFSFEVGAAKPDPAIYQEACRRLNVPPHAAVFVGDGMHDELTGAARAGMVAVQALSFLRRWPHFRSEPQIASHCLRNVEDVSALVNGSAAVSPDAASVSVPRGTFTTDC